MSKLMYYPSPSAVNLVSYKFLLIGYLSDSISSPSVKGTDPWRHPDILSMCAMWSVLVNIELEKFPPNMGHEPKCGHFYGPDPQLVQFLWNQRTWPYIFRGQESELQVTHLIIFQGLFGVFVLLCFWRTICTVFLSPLVPAQDSFLGSRNFGGPRFFL